MFQAATSEGGLRQHEKQYSRAFAETQHSRTDTLVERPLLPACFSPVRAAASTNGALMLFLWWCGVTYTNSCCSSLKMTDLIYSHNIRPPLQVAESEHPPLRLGYLYLFRRDDSPATL